MYNESANVKPLADRICGALMRTNRSFEIILVDDGSIDDTWKEINAQTRVHPEVRGVRHKRNAGQSAGLWTGIRASRGAVIATLDGDLQNDPDDFPQMLSLLGEA